MANNMTIGPAVMVGGNEVQMTTKGKVQVTNPKGKVVTLSQDQFQKQTLKNIDKLQNGEEFEYKKDHKALKIAGAVAGTAAVVTGIIYRKEIARYMKDFSFKKLWNDIKDLFRAKSKGVGEAPAGHSAEYRQSRAQALEETFNGYDGDKVVEGLKKGKKPEELGLTRRSTFIPNKDNPQLKRKQTIYMSDKEKAKRRARLEQLRKKYNITPETFFQSGYKEASKKFGWNK